jgi:hypothetical protein
MINNHPDRCNAPAWHNNSHSQKTFARKNRSRVQSGPMLWRSVGAAILVVLIIGVASTLWFGNRIRTALDEIGKAKEIHTELISRNDELQTRKGRLLDRAHIEAVAKKLGLYPPGDGQKRTL